MTGQLIYPKWNINGPWWVGDGSVTMAMDHVKWGIHDTETATFPSYTYGGIPMGSAPTCTYDPWTHQWRGHFRANQSARAFRNGPGGEYVNRADVMQTEIVGYCDPALVAKYGHAVSKIDDQAVNDLGDFGVWGHEEWGMDIDFYPEALPWPVYPKGTTRMTWARYQTWSGVLGHMAVPFNTHLDPGDLPMDKIKAHMLGQSKDPWPVRGDTGPAVIAMVGKLRLAGYYAGRRGDTEGLFGIYTENAIKRLQQAQGWSGPDADGTIGPETWKRIQGLPDPPPKDPPPHQPPPTLLDQWQRATGDTRRAQDAEIALGEAFVKTQPNRHALETVLTSQKQLADTETENWRIIHDAAT